MNKKKLNESQLENHRKIVIEYYEFIYGVGGFNMNYIPDTVDGCIARVKTLQKKYNII